MRLACVGDVALATHAASWTVDAFAAWKACSAVAQDSPPKTIGER